MVGQPGPESDIVTSFDPNQVSVVENDTRQASLLKRVGQLATATVASLALIGPGPALAQAPQTLPDVLNQTPTANCALPLTVLGGASAECDTGRLPAGCVTTSGLIQMEHFQSDPANRYLAKQIVDSLPGPSLSPDSHQVSLGNEDDSATVLNTNGDREASLMLSRTEGADWERAVIYVDKFQDPQFVIQHYDAAIRAYKLCGFKVELTLACNHKTWKSPHEYAHFAASVARRYYGQVDAISTCNEPNNTEDGWLKPLPNLTLPQTERVMHMAAYRAIKAVDSRIKVYVGELSSQDSPLVFMKQVLAYNPKGFAGPLLADAESAHPYEWFTDKGDGTVPPFDLNPDPDSETIAIDSTDTYADFLDEAYASGQIATAEGKEPHIVFDEFGLSVRAVGRLSSRNVSDPFRTRIIISVINTLNQRNAERQQAGKEPLFDELSLYQQQSTKETWNTGIIDGHGRPDSTFYALCLLANRR